MKTQGIPDPPPSSPTIDGLFGVQPQHLQQMAGNVLPFVSPTGNIRQGQWNDWGLMGIQKLGRGNVDMGNVTALPITNDQKFLQDLLNRLK